MVKQIFKIIVLLIIITNLFLNVLYGMGTPEGTILSNVKDYFAGSFILPKNYFASQPGELVAGYTNINGVTNKINGKYYFVNSLFKTNITTMTVSAGHDISSIPSQFSGNGKKGVYADYVFIITNKSNISDDFYIRISSVATDDTNWTGNIFSLFTNNNIHIDQQSSIFTFINGVSPDERLNLKVRLYIPANVVNLSTNLFSFEIWNSNWNTNTSTGDKWPGVSAIPPATPDTNDSRDYQICYINTKSYGTYHTVSVTSADDMIHTIDKFDGTQPLGPTRIRINITMFPAPVDMEDFYLIYNINKIPTGNNPDDVKIKIESDGNYYYAIILAENDKRIKEGNTLNFIIVVDNEIYYQDGRDGTKPWSFKIKSIIMQKNNVSILKNLLNPRKGDKAIVFYSLNKPSKVNIDVYTLSGEKIANLFNGHQNEGWQNPVYWDGTNDHGNEVGEGLYFVSLRTDEFNELRKVIVVK